VTSANKEANHRPVTQKRAVLSGSMRRKARLWCVVSLVTSSVWIFAASVLIFQNQKA